MSKTLYILDKQEKVINFLKNSGGASDCSPYFDDVLTEDLQTGAETFQFTTISKGDLARDLSIGNYVAFKRNGKTKLFQIVQTEETHDETVYVTVYCECAGLELLNKVFRKRTLTSVSLRRFLETVLDETGWNVGYVDASSTVSLDLEIGDENIYAILQNNLSNFGVELDFRVELNGGGISNKYVDTYHKRGTITGKRFTFGKDIEGITRKTDSTSLYTALIGRGKNGLTFKDIQVEGINKPVGQDYVADQESFDKYNHNGYHIVGVYNFETESPQELLRETYKRLQEVKEPKVEYEIPVAILGDLLGASWETISIGDTVGIYDNAFNPPIRLMARVSKLETSITNPQGNKCTLANFVEVGSNITDEMRKIASKLEGYVDAQFPIGGDKIQDGAIGQDQMNQQYMNQISADIVKASVVEAEKVIADEIEAVTGRFENIEAEHGSFKEITTNKIEAIEGNFNEINADLGNFKEISTDKISAVEGKFDKVQADLVKTNTIVAGLGEFDLVVTDRINAVEGNFETINADYGNFKQVTTDKLTATEGRIEELDSDLITTKTIVGNLGKFDDVIAERVDAVEGTFVELEAEVGRINTLVSGNITSDNIHSSGISSDKLTINNGFIKNAMIDSISASKINAGEINTNKVHITSANGGIVIADNTQQFKDKNGKVRIQMGQDASGNFNFGVFDATGSGTLIDATGVKEKALADGIIKDRMIGQGEIGGNKINISSMIDEVNKESNTKTIKGSKVQLDTQGQTLDVAFNSLKTNVDNIEIGGRNFVLNSKFKTSDKWYRHQATYEIIADESLKTNVAKVTAGSTGNSGIYQRIGDNHNLESGDYTFSVYVKGDNGVLVTIALERAISKTITLTEAWTRYDITMKANQFSTWNKTITIYGASSSVFYVGLPKVEKGNMVSDYSEAPEDIDSKIESNTTAISVQQGKINTLIQDTTIEKNGQSLKLKDEYSKLEQTVGGISSTVGSHTTSITALGGRIDTANSNISKLDGKVTTANNNISNISGKVTEVESKQATFKQDLDGFKQTVSNTYTTKTELSNTNKKVDGLTTTVGDVSGSLETTKTQVAGIVTNLDSITQRVSSTETNVESVIETSNTALATANQNKADIGKKANATDVYKKSETYTKNQTDSAITTAKNEITLGVSQTYETKSNVEEKISSAKTELNTTIDNIKVGGVNLIVRHNAHIDKMLNQDGELSNSNYTETMKEYISVTPKEVLTFQKQYQDEYFRYNWYDANKNYISRRADNKKEFQWTVPDNAYYIWVSYPKNGWVKVERGNKASDWTPSPEDVQANINLKANTTDVYNKSETYTKSETDSAIKIAKDEINLGVSSTYETKSNVETKISSANTNTLNSAKSYADTKKTEAISSASADATSKVNSAKSELNTAINNINVGGRNYVKNALFNGSSNWSGLIIDSTKKHNGHNVARISASGNTTNKWTGFSQHNVIVSPKAGDEYTVSCWYLVEDKSTLDMSFAVELKAVNTSGSQVSAGSYPSVTASSVTNGVWTKFSYTMKITRTDIASLFVFPWVSRNGEVWFSEIKVEKGNKVTDFSVAPEDLDTEINKKANSVDVYKKTETYTKSETDSKINISKEAIELGVKNTYETKSNVESKISGIRVGAVNLINPNTITSGKFLTNTGSYTSNSEWFTSDYIPVSGMKKIVTSGFSNLGQSPSTCYYDLNKNFVKGINNNNQSLSKEITIDSGIHYIRFSGMIRDLETLVLENVDGTISTKANSSDVYKKTETYTKSETDSKINIAKDSINLAVSNTYETKSNVETKISSANTNTLNSAKSYADTKKNEAISSASTDATNKVNSAKTELSNTINNIKVGGRNLILNSALNGGSNWSGTVSVDTSKKLGNCNSLKFTGSASAYSSSTPAKVGDVFTVSVKSFVGTSGGNLPLIIFEEYKDDTLTRINYQETTVSSTLNSWQPYEKTWTVKNAETTNVRMRIYNRTASYNFWASQPKLEKGNKATDWTPAPEDIDSALGTKANSTDVYTKSEVYTKSQTDSAINVAKDAINLSVSNTYETKTNVTSKINTANTNTLNSAKSYADTKKTEAISSASADATNKANAVKEEFNKALNDMEIGGRNLAKNTSNIFKTYKMGEWNCFTHAYQIADLGLKVGDSVALKLYVKFGDTLCGGKARITFYDASGANLKSPTANKYILKNSEGYTEVVATIPSDTVRIAIGLQREVSGTGLAQFDFQAREIMFEKSTKCSAWSPAPEDLIDKIDTKANSTDVYTKSEVYTKSQTDSAINVAKDAINLSVSNTYETKTNVTSKINTANTNTLNSAKSYADTKKNEAISSASTDATNKVNSAKTELNTKINNIQIGGRNLMPDSAPKTSDAGWAGTSGTRTLVSDTSAPFGQVLKATYSATGTSGGAYKMPKAKLTVGKTYSWSVWLKSSKAMTINVGLEQGGTKSCNVTTSWQKFTHTFTAVDNSKYAFIMYVNGTTVNSGDYYLVHSIMVEEGNKPSDWSPAPEDINADINKKANSTDVYNKSEVYTKNETNSQISATTNAITSRVSSLESTTSTLNGTITKHENRLKTAESKITDSAIINTVSSTIQSAKNEAINSANTNTTNQLKNYATTASLTQTTNSITAKFESTGGYNLVENSTGYNKNKTGWANTSNDNSKIKVGTSSSSKNTTGFSIYIDREGETGTSANAGVSRRFRLKANTTYTVSGDVMANAKTKGIKFMVKTSDTIEHTDAENRKDHTTTYTVFNGKSSGWSHKKLTFTTGDSVKSGVIYMEHLGYDSADTGTTTNRVYWSAICLVEGDMERQWSPHPNEIYTGSTVIDATGVTVNNGALKVKDGSGNMMLEGDSSGVLYLKKQLNVGTIGTFNTTGININGGSLNISGGSPYKESSTGYVEGSTTSQKLYNNGLYGSSSVTSGSQTTRSDSFYGSNGWSVYEDNSANATQQSFKSYSRGSGIYIQATETDKGSANAGKLVEKTRLNHEGLKTSGTINVTGKITASGGMTNSGTYVKTGQGAGFIINNSTSRTIMFSSTTLGEHIFGGNNASSNEVTDYIRVGVNKLQYTTGGTNHTIYHSGNKPSPSTLGAVAKSGDTMTGRLKITSNSNTVEIGSQNTSYCHLHNSANIPFHFNRTVRVAGDIYAGTNYDQKVAYGSMSNGYDNGTGEVCEGRIHIGGNKYIYYGWCSVYVTAGTSAERTYTVPNLSRIRGITIQCYTKGGTGNFGELALKQTYSNGFTFRLYNATNTGTHYITYMIIGE